MKLRPVPPRNAQQARVDVGRRIAELRSDAGLTQEALAASLRCAPRYVQSVEGGQVNLTLHSLVRFATRLGVDVRELFVAPVSVKPGLGRPRRRSRDD